MPTMWGRVGRLFMKLWARQSLTVKSIFKLERIWLCWTPIEWRSTLLRRTGRARLESTTSSKITKGVSQLSKWTCSSLPSTWTVESCLHTTGSLTASVNKLKLSSPFSSMSAYAPKRMPFTRCLFTWKKTKTAEGSVGTWTFVSKD